MFDPVNFVIIENGIAEVLQNKRSSSSVIYNFTDPDQARLYACSSGEPVDLLHGCAEGGFLIDFDKMFALVFGPKFESDKPTGRVPKRLRESFEETARVNNAYDLGTNEYLNYISGGWPDWTLRWAENVFAFEDYVRENCSEHPFK